ncbi:tetratricopeptide repeat protein [Croceicoccus sp. Ery15]|uniref:tetratricopeptide repeat protein n=1 Tax=Croceicoccus sp. Ery15 TaxID=1703338 RepID=UPI001E3F21E8|nr:tetratricopeptide repeat protein [Croceicoccus sp. Ery15]
MSWFIVVPLAVAVFAALIFVLKLPRPAWELTGSALLLGLAGYAAQGSPSLQGAPKPPRESRESMEAALVEVRQGMQAEFAPGRRYLVTADAMTRNGQFSAAAAILRGAIREHPDDPDAWLALGNALVGHAQGIATPAALYSYDKAAALAPRHPGPPFFAGLALAQTGRYAEARDRWQSLLDRPLADGDTADSEPWRAVLEAQVRQLDALIEAQQGQMPAPAGPMAAPAR